jgi:hypothetical protein
MAKGFENIFFGNITEKPLPFILRNSKDFKKKFISNNSSLPCNSCPKRRILELKIEGMSEPPLSKSYFFTSSVDF